MSTNNNGYLKLFFSFSNDVQRLSDAEIGRLVLQMLAYAKSGDEDSYLSEDGFDSVLFPVMKGIIDRDKLKQEEFSASQAEKGRLGGKAKAAKKASSSLARKSTQNSSQATKTTSFLAMNKEKEEEEEKEKESPPSSSYDSDGAGTDDGGAGDSLAPSSASVIDYIDHNLFRMTSGNYDSLRELMADGITEELVKYAVDEALSHGSRNWAYVQACLNKWLVNGCTTVNDVKTRCPPPLKNNPDTRQGSSNPDDYPDPMSFYRQ